MLNPKSFSYFRVIFDNIYRLRKIRMDPKYELEAPQYVDFQNLAENDNEADEFFNEDMGSDGESWVTANNTLDERVAASHEGNVASNNDLPEPVSTDSEGSSVKPPTTSVNHDIPKQLRKPPSNLVTSWEGPVTRILGKGIFSTKSTHQKKGKPTQGKVGRVDIQSYVQAATRANTWNKPKQKHRTPRRLPVGNKRSHGCTPKRLGTNLPGARLPFSRPRTQIHKSLSTPTASKSRRKFKSPKSPISIPFPKTPHPAVMQRSRNLLSVSGDFEQVDNTQHPEPQILVSKENNSQNKFKSQAEQIHLYQNSTPSRFRSRSKHSKSGSVGHHITAPASSHLGARPRTTASGAQSTLPNTKTKLVETNRNNAKNNVQESKDRQFDKNGLDKGGKSLITIPAPFKFSTEMRAEERAKFDLKLRERENAAKEKKRLEDEEKSRKDTEELARTRRELVHKALPIRCSKPMMIKKSDKMPTNPVTPQFQRSISMRKKNNCGK